MYSIETLFSRTHYHCSNILARFKHVWLMRVLEKSFLQDLVTVSKKTILLHELRYTLKPGMDIEVQSIDDVHRLLGIGGVDEPTRKLIKRYISLVGRSNIVQSLSARHPLLLLYSITEGCLYKNRKCVIEPSIQVSDHEKNRELERRRLLPYRLFDLLVAKDQELGFIEVKYSRYGKKQIPHGTILAYLASFLEKLVSTETLIGDTLRRGGYKHSYRLVVIVAPGTLVDNSVRRHVETITRSISTLAGVDVKASILAYKDIVEHADQELQAETTSSEYTAWRAII